MPTPGSLPRRLSLLLAPAALAVLLAACAAPQTPTLQQPGGQEASAEMKPQKGGILVGPSKRMPSCLDVVAERCDSSALKSTFMPQWESIIDFDYIKPGLETQGVGKFGPRLAESWKQTDPRTWDFTLKKGIKWHDGKDFSAEDVLFSLDRWKDTTSNGRVRTTADSFEKVESTGPYHVRITLKAASPSFLDSITGIEPRIMPAHIAKQAGNPTGDALVKLYDANPVGTGPFKFRKYDKGAQIAEMERFDGYHIDDGPYLDGMRVLLLKDLATWMAAFATGKIDFVTLDDKVQTTTLARSVPNATTYSYMLGNTGGIAFNLTRAPWNDVRVRRAVHLAVDRESLRQTITSGEGMAGYGPLPPVSTQAGWGVPFDEFMKLPGYRQPKAQDIAEAKKLLAEAGVPAGLKVTIKHDRGSAAPSATAEPLAGLLRDALGWEVNAQPMEPAHYLAEVEVERKFDITAKSMGVAYQILNDLPAFWHSKGAENFTGVNDPEMDRMIEAVSVEMDGKKRNQLLIQLQRHFHDKMYAVQTPMLVKYMMTHPWLHNFYGSLQSNPVLYNSNVYWLETEKIPADRRSW